MKTKKDYFKKAKIDLPKNKLPENDEEYKACDKDIILHDCHKCIYIAICNSENHLTLTTNIPKRIIDFYWPKLHQNEKAILIFLANKANFVASDPRHGVAYATKNQISKGTGVPVSNMHKYILSLARKGLITKEQSGPMLDKESVSWHSTTVFVVSWFKKMEEMKKSIRNIKSK